MDQLRRLRATTTVMVTMTAMLALSVTAAFAQYPPDVDFGVTCVEDNGTIECEVQGAQPGETLQVTATAEVLGVIYEESLRADEAGEASFSFSRGDADEEEDIVVRVVGSESGEASDEIPGEDEDERAEGIEAPDDDDDDRLPVTGGQILLLSVLGLGLIGGGALALRKRGSSVA